ncbi:RND efflux system, membrane fusion protein [hydrothermal vent metagenome]|uniref:RND efflux system, membrane fusion protein n=1 Tax=hydrothermal vent metagenome TaxID=652676 RepID=A0A3B1BA50_9ZZZZ
MTKKISILTFLAIALVLSIAGINKFIQNGSAVEASSSGKIKSAAMPVEIVIVQEQAIKLWTEFSGRLSAVDYVEIRPQATGLITEVRFEDGQYVNKGDILYVIDPRSLKSLLAQESADLIVAQTLYNLANKEYQRAKDLNKKKLISRQLYDERANTRLVAGSAVKRAQAKVSEAEINLSHAYIKSPVSGYVSRAELTVGNLVSAGPNAPLLTTIVSSANIYADFEIDEQTFVHYIDRVSSTQKLAREILVELRLQSGDSVYLGKIHAFDNRIDSTSGTIRARAIFENPEGKLLPGMYAHLKLESMSKVKTILINERAISTDQNRKFVYVVNDENKTTYREVHLGRSIGGDRIIRSGLANGDKVVVRGTMRIRPDMLVEPKIATAAKSTAGKS